MTHTHSHTHQASLLLLFLLRGSVECLISSHQPPPPPPPPPLPPHIQTKIKGRDAFLPLPSHSSYTFASAPPKKLQLPERDGPKNMACDFEAVVSKVHFTIANHFSPSKLMQLKGCVSNISLKPGPPAHTDCWCFLWLQWGLRVNTEESVSAVSPGSVMNTWWYLTVRFL